MWIFTKPSCDADLKEGVDRGVGDSAEVCLAGVVDAEDVGFGTLIELDDGLFVL